MSESTARISPSLSVPAKPGMAERWPPPTWAAGPSLVRAKSTASGWCQVWPVASCGGAGRRSSGPGERQSGWPSRAAPWQAAQWAA